VIVVTVEVSQISSTKLEMTHNHLKSAEQIKLDVRRR
jgi:hypothetical protein